MQSVASFNQRAEKRLILGAYEVLIDLEAGSNKANTSEFLS